MLSSLQGTGIDINMGCSAPDIMHCGAGVSWMTKPLEETRTLVHEVKAAAGDKRLSVKLRLGGEDFTESRFFQFTDMLVREGVSQLALHPRTSKEKYRLPPRWEYVEQLALRYKEQGISVILNGAVNDMRSLNAALAAAPHCAGVMVGRAAVTYPWIFAVLSTGLQHTACRFTVDRELVALNFIDMLEKYQPAEFLKTRLQRFFAYYCMGFSFAHYFQTQMLNAKDCADARFRVHDYFMRESTDKLLAVVSGEIQE